MGAILFWAVIAVVCLGLEVHTNAFVSVFIGFAAAVTFILALAAVPFVLQAIVWLAVSGASIALLRPMALRRFSHRYEVDMSRPTANPMTDKRGLVESTVGDERHPGRVKIQGESWRAVTDWPEEIPDGTPIVVTKAYGTTLWVTPV